MDYLSGDVCWDEQGTFVFEALRDVTVRSHPHGADQFKTNIHFFEGELVAIDLVRPSPNGTLLRLSDGCGWLFQHDGTDDVMTRVRNTVMSSPLFRFILPRLASRSFLIHFPSPLLSSFLYLF